MQCRTKNVEGCYDKSSVGRRRLWKDVWLKKPVLDEDGCGRTG